MTNLTNKQLAKLWTVWFAFTFAWGFWHGYNQVPMTGLYSWAIQLGSIGLTIWCVIRLWHTPDVDG